MLAASKPSQGPSGLSRSRGANDLVAAEQKAHHREDAKVVAHPANEVEGALRIGAAPRAAYYDNIEGQSPDAQEYVALLTAQPAPKPLSAIAAAEQSLREELLSNDSLGG